VLQQKVDISAGRFDQKFISRFKKNKKIKIPGLWRFFFHAYNQVFKAFSTG